MSDQVEEVGAEAEKSQNFLQRMREALTRSSRSLSEGINSIFSKRKLDAATLEELEDLLISADLGIDTAAEITETIGEGRHDKQISPEEVRGLIAAEIAKRLEPVSKPLPLNVSKKPFVILVVGVNGGGKTTTIGKLASMLVGMKKKVILVAGDTFRAAAIEQLTVWGERIGAPVVSAELGADAAGLAYDALEKAKREEADVLIVDTAGRLQNKADLMAELKKIIRVMRKLDPQTPHSTLLVLDATTGQNALNQVEVFKDSAEVTGLVMTKLDGTARGGILVAVAERFGLPVHMIGVGEGVEDLQPFDPQEFAEAVTGALPEKS